MDLFDEYLYLYMNGNIRDVVGKVELSQTLYDLLRIGTSFVLSPTFSQVSEDQLDLTGLDVMVQHGVPLNNARIMGVSLTPDGPGTIKLIDPPEPDDRGLYPFDPEKKCDKCGGNDIYTGYYNRSDDSFYCGYSTNCRIYGEHMHRSCRRCGYQWVENILVKEG